RHRDGRGIESDPVIADPKLYPSIYFVDGHPGPRGPSVLDDVRHSLLSDSVKDDFMSGVEAPAEVALEGAGKVGVPFDRCQALAERRRTPSLVQHRRATRAP